MKRRNINLCRNLRKKQTLAEQKLWKLLKNRQLEGIKFKRQFSVGKYILDFYSPEHKLGLEADGGQHFEKEGIIKDKIREKELLSVGIKMIRFADNDILNNLDGVCQVILENIKTPHLNPLPEGARRIPVAILLAFILCSLALPSFAGVRGKVNQGNSYYHRKDYQGAFDKYRDALIDEPESKEVHFNLGDSLYKRENYEEALKEFEKATYSKDIKLQSRAYYNMGNCLYKTEKMPESIQFYKKALELNPNDDDAKYNIEFVQKKIKENMEKKPQEGNKQQQEKNQKQDKSKDDKNKDNKDKDKQKEEQGKQEKKDKAKEEAQQLLKSFDENEKEAQKKRIRMPTQGNAEYDW